MNFSIPKVLFSVSTWEPELTQSLVGVKVLFLYRCMKIVFAIKKTTLIIFVA